MTHEVLTNRQMAKADRDTIKRGTAGFELMQNAGAAVVEEMLTFSTCQKALILCGPGNNGGDGFIIAQLLQKKGWEIELACLVDIGSLKGDAAIAANSCGGEAKGFDEIKLADDALIIDAVFGTGFSGELKPPVSNVFQQIKDKDLPVIAVDIPSGINGNTGASDSHALDAQLTITFHRKKLGHVLYPGAGRCGEIVVKDIGIAVDLDCDVLENHPDLWREDFPLKCADTHKYNYGHACIYAAPELTGATCLAAESCARVGAGLTSVISPADIANIYRSSLPAHIMVRDGDGKWFDQRVTAVLYGPGGLSSKPEIRPGIKTVLDADALKNLPDNLNENTILTPHDGEFAAAFPDIKGSKLERAREAARQSGAIIVLKGSDTVIAYPCGRAIINSHAAPSLATAGTGDVLAGMITGLLAQGMEPFGAACASIWIHGECARRFGAGLVASDLPDIIPPVLQDLIG